jgi:hypothetical protein
MSSFLRRAALMISGLSALNAAGWSGKTSDSRRGVADATSITVVVTYSIGCAVPARKSVYWMVTSTVRPSLVTTCPFRPRSGQRRRRGTLTLGLSNEAGGGGADPAVRLLSHTGAGEDRNLDPLH